MAVNASTPHRPVANGRQSQAGSFFGCHAERLLEGMSDAARRAVDAVDIRLETGSTRVRLTPVRE
jgi:hypothetical protein